MVAGYINTSLPVGYLDIHLINKKLKTILKGVTLLLLFFISTLPSQAQNNEEIDTLTYAFLPALGYNSDLGLMGGGIMSRYQYKGGLRPFYSYLSIDALASTKGLLSAEVLYDKPQVLGSPNRLTSFAYLSRFLQNQFYGIGNYNELINAPDEYSDFYLFKSFSAGFEIAMQRPLLVFNNGSKFNLLAAFTFDYVTPFSNGPVESRLINQIQPLGYEGARTVAVGAGFVWENRNNEFNPEKGFYAKALFETGTEWIGSSYNYLSLKTDLRSYTSFHLIKDVTFANRLFYHLTSGEVTYWNLAELGGELSMRGYPENRFLDDNVLFLNTELRTWLFDFPESDFRLGGTLFIDAGRTFSHGTSFSSIFEDLKYTYGFGGTASFFTNEFILRADVGFSEEGYGVYFTAGYMF